MLEDNLISKRQKDGLKGYRLMRKGKEGLLQMDADKFSFYLADGADFSMRKSTLTQRMRQHRVSETLAMMEQAGIPKDRDQKAHLFEEERSQSEAYTQAAFFHPKEVKVQTDLTRKIISSRMTGVWLSDDALRICYNIGTMLPTWFETVENRADILVRSMLREKGIEFPVTDAVLFGKSMEQAVDCLKDDKMRAYLMNASFGRFCYIPLDERGVIQLKLMNDQERYQCLKNILSEDLEVDMEDLYPEHDGYNADGLPTLICIDCDLKRLIRFRTRLQYMGRSGEVICFDFQKEAIRSYCGEETKISTVDLETVNRRILAGG